MNTIIIPTDFSTTAANAAEFALHFAQQVKAKRILLFHAYELPIALDPLMPGVQMLELDSYKNTAQDNIIHFQENLAAKFPNTNLLIDTVVEYGSISNGLEQIEKREKIEFIIMGITGGGAIEETLIGSNTISVASSFDVPVLIIPPMAHFVKVENIMLACDFDHADKYIPVDIIQQMIDDTKAKLLVFNLEVDMEESKNNYPAKVMGEGFAVHSVLQDFKPEYFFSKSDEYVDGVNDFADTHNVQMIISMPKRHSFFEKLFIKSRTKKLAFHTHIPLLVIHKKE